MKDWNIKIYRGILTGCNEAFIINGAKKDELIAADPKSAEIIRPILRGRDIKRYGYNFADLWLISTFPSKKYDIDDYPAVRDYLLSFGIEKLEQTGKEYIINGNKIKARKKTNNKWFETQDSISYWDNFSKQKIVYREIGKQMDSCLIDEEIYVNNKCYIITGDNLYYLTCFLNSKIFTNIIFKEVNITGGKGKEFLKNVFLPIPSNSYDWKQLYHFMVQTPNDKDKNILINNIFYKIYKLSNLEQQYIESI